MNKEISSNVIVCARFRPINSREISENAKVDGFSLKVRRIVVQFAQFWNQSFERTV